MPISPVRTGLIPARRRTPSRALDGRRGGKVSDSDWATKTETALSPRPCAHALGFRDFHAFTGLVTLSHSSLSRLRA
ncbi:hypothetical protein J6590_013134 [Homalodisca vitripennis]|nr:hypothetical protein J6590_013134 [Homalodisca vitripennis]